MSRLVSSMFIVTGRLVAISPIHVGGHDTSVSPTLKLGRNGLGQCYIPGTSLAGALRAAFSEGDFDEEFWGSGPIKGKTDGSASRILIEDAVIEVEQEPEVRQGVGIDRYFGRASDGIKYEREVLPAGTSFKFQLSCESSDESEPKGFAALIQVLKSGKLQIGAAQTRGLGVVQLVDSTCVRRGLATRNDMLKTLRALSEGRSGEAYELSEDAKIDKSARASISIKWRPDGPLMVAAAQKTEMQNVIVPLISEGKERRLVIPGSSIKGVFRSHAERIMATVLYHASLQSNASTDRFLDQVRRFHLVNVLFGAAKGAGEKNAVRLGRGALTVRDCHATSSVSESDLAAWADLAAYRETTSRAHAPRDLNEPYIELATRVAIDRWTGGASDSALYCVAEPWDIAWEPIHIEIEADRLNIPELDPDGGGIRVNSETIAKAASALLYLVLQDFKKGLLPIGFSTNRGMGAVRDVACAWRDAENVEVNVGALREGWASYLAQVKPSFGLHAGEGANV